MIEFGDIEIWLIRNQSLKFHQFEKNNRHFFKISPQKNIAKMDAKLQIHLSLRNVYVCVGVFFHFVLQIPFFSSSFVQ